MANRGEIRTLLRRRIHDVGGAEWSDAELNILINLAYAKVQKEVYKVARNSHLFWDTINVVANTSWYPVPESTFGLHRVGLLNTSTGVYTKLSRKDYEDVMGLSGTETYYAPVGQWIGIFPAPTANITAGLQIIHTPLMAVNLDADVPRVKVPVHDAIVDWAVVLCLGETEEASQEARQRLQDVLADLALWYETPGDTPEKLRVEL